MADTFNDAWGFSKLDVFETCKAKFYYQFIKKLPSGGSPAMERGSKMHENIESYLNGWAADLIPDNQLFKQAIDELKAKDFRAEQAMGFDKEWNALSDWFQKSTWLRVKMDASYIDGEHGYAIDFKSGKYRVPSTEQPELYGIALHAKNPELTKVTAEFWFLDTGEVYSRDYTADELLKLRKKYEKRVEPIYMTSQWDPSPSNECRWCTYSKTKGGACKY
jgi:PD-(D/E)XK nuclease superfamily